MKPATGWASEFCRQHIISTRNNVLGEFLERVQVDAQTEYVEALTLIWPFIEEELKQMITPAFAIAIKAIAGCLRKHVVIEKNASGMFYLREVQS